MLIIFVSTILVFFIIGSVYFFKTGKFISIVLMGCSLLSVIPIKMAQCNHPLQIDYPYQATVQLPNNNIKSTIYFKSFSQDDNKIIINDYATDAIHWGDFKGYDLVNSTLTIVLTDNNNQFIYQNRQTQETYNEPVNYATQ